MVISEHTIVYGKSGVPFTVVAVEGENLLVVSPERGLLKVARSSIEWWHPPFGSYVFTKDWDEAFVIGASPGKLKILFVEGDSGALAHNQIEYWKLYGPNELEYWDKLGAYIPGDWDQSKIGLLSEKDFKPGWSIVRLLSVKPRTRPQPDSDYAYIPHCGIYPVQILSTPVLPQRQSHQHLSINSFEGVAV